MPAGPDIPVCLALSLHPKIKSFTNKTKGRAGGKYSFYSFYLWWETSPPTAIIVIKPHIS